MNEQERKQKILEEVIQEAQRTCPSKLPGEFSVMDFARMANIKRDQARKIIVEKVETETFKARETSKGTFYSVV